MKKLPLTFLAFLLAPAVALAAPSSPSSPVAPPRTIEVATSRIHLHDLGVAGPGIPDVDLGAAPALGATRTIDRDEVTRALTAASSASVPKLAAQFRVARKARRLTTGDIDKLVREGIEPARIPRGAKLAAVRGVAVPVPDGYDKVSVDLPAMPRRAGTVTMTAAVTFAAQGEVLARITVPVDLEVSPEALIPDVAKGAAITLVVRRGLVEVSIGAVAGADGDTGGILPVLLKPSGRVVRARIVDKDHAVSIEES
jgi:Chaperone for flagella basal body P-ring formation